MGVFYFTEIDRLSSLYLYIREIISLPFVILCVESKELQPFTIDLSACLFIRKAEREKSK